MAEQDCTVDQLSMLGKFFLALAYGKPVPLSLDVTGLSEEQEFIARITAERIIEIGVKIPKGLTLNDYNDRLKEALRQYILGTERDTPDNHELINTITPVEQTK
jgi:hypothetical protein